MAGDSRTKMVRSAASLIGTHGATATSFADVLADSGAPRGSIYHHFPDGKRQLTEEAVRLTAAAVLERQGACAASTPAGVLEWFIDLWRQVVVVSAGRAGCAIAGVAVDTAADDAEVLAVVRAAFGSWMELLAAQLVSTGLPPDRASAVATVTLATMEGALILCRAEGGVGPLEVAGAELLRLVATSTEGHQV